MSEIVQIARNLFAKYFDDANLSEKQYKIFSGFLDERFAREIIIFFSCMLVE